MRLNALKSLRMLDGTCALPSLTAAAVQMLAYVSTTTRACVAASQYLSLILTYSLDGQMALASMQHALPIARQRLQCHHLLTQIGQVSWCTRSQSQAVLRPVCSFDHPLEATCSAERFTSFCLRAARAWSNCRLAGIESSCGWRSSQCHYCHQHHLVEHAAHALP